ncbi:MAG: GNAT family N-acetyltransferase [Gaiellaceae bacterium]
MTAATQTVRLRMEPLDLAAHEGELAALHADPRVMATMGGEGTREQSRAWIERNLRHGEDPGLGIFVFRERETGRFVGRGAIRRIEIGGRTEVEVGYALAFDAWGQGYATEMAEALVAHAEAGGHGPLVAYTEPRNAASRRVLEKVGFRYERDLVHHGRDQVLYRRKETP